MAKGVCSRLCHWGPIGAIGIIKWITLTASYCNTMWWPLKDTGGTANFFTLLALSILTLYHFLSAMLDGPGYVEIGWKPEKAEDEGYLQWCEVCRGFKVPRSHHCRKCGRCVKKMDHHCPWINNCVGHANHGHFIGFLFFAVCGATHAALTLAASLYYGLNRTWYHYYGDGTEPKIPLTLGTLVGILLGLGLSIGVVLAVGALCYFQLSSAWRNQTGIEDWIMEKAAYRLRGQERMFVNPYRHSSRWRNLRQVVTLGCGAVGDGVTWELREGSGRYDMTVEQLLQKQDKRDRTRQYKIVAPFSGSWLPLASQGCRVACSPPCTDEPRIRLAEGDVVRVTRWKKHWLYGDKLIPSLPGKAEEEEEKEAEKEASKGCDRVRGWFPRRCAMDVAEFNHRQRMAAAAERKKVK